MFKFGKGIKMTSWNELRKNRQMGKMLGDYLEDKR